MRALFLLQFILTAGSIGWLAHRQSQEHDHSKSTSDVAVRSYETAAQVAGWQASLASGVSTAIGDQETTVKRRLDGVCLALELLAKTHEGRERLPLPTVAACPDLPQATGSAHVKLDPLRRVP